MMFDLLNSLKKIFGTSYRYNPIKNRSNCFHEWQAIFPEKDKELEIFIEIIYNSFLVPKKLKYNVKPTDTVEFYYNMSKNELSDNLECEFFLKKLNQKFKFQNQENLFNIKSSFENIFKIIISEKKL